MQQIGWNLNYAGIASMWRGGCIIKVAFTPSFHEKYLTRLFTLERLLE
jgi:6-phosphogluconate dehydrogenase